MRKHSGKGTLTYEGEFVDTEPHGIGKSHQKHNNICFQENRRREIWDERFTETEQWQRTYAVLIIGSDWVR
eukprot:scaffold8400_cov213-Skeletonema_marinoi.AAC.5